MSSSDPHFVDTMADKGAEHVQASEDAGAYQDVYGLGANADSVDGAPTYTVGGGGDWDELATEVAALGAERIVVNMGPQHPSTHGVLRLVLELDGETVREARAGIGFLHTGIEKNMEFRTWTQGTTFCTRMDYLTPIFNEAAYCLAVEKLLGITDQIPQRASDIRVLMMELNRIGSHLICLATGGMELGATTIMTIGFRERERILRFFEAVTGLRMNHAYVRPGGVAQDVLPEHLDLLESELPGVRAGVRELELLLLENPIYKGRTVDVGYLSLASCMALGVTGPILRSTGLPHDLRKSDPYCGYETYEFDVVTRRDADAYSRTVIRFDEIWQSLRIVEQAIERLRASQGEPVMVADRKIAWPAQLSVGADGQGNSLDHIREIMGESMEGLIHHFKLVTEGFRVPPGQVYASIESPKGELAAHVVSDGGTRPYRAHFRDPSFHNLQAASALAEGGLVADVIVAVASIDPVMGGVDR